MSSPALRDLVTVLYKPRETMRRILDGGAKRWTAEIIILAFICTAFGDPDIHHLRDALPGLTLTPTLAFVALVLLFIAACWVLFVFAFAWLIAFAGKMLGGSGPVADVRAALAWGSAPLIWSVVYRIPVGLYWSQMKLHLGDAQQISLDFLQQGGCSLALVVIALQFAFDIWILFIASSTVAEALHFETWKGLATIAAGIAVPVVIGLAAFLAYRM